MTLDDLIAQARETVRRAERAKHLHGCGDRAPNADVAAGFYEDAADAAGEAEEYDIRHAPTMAAALVAIGPALVEWREAHAAVADVGPSYRAAERSGDPDAHFAASVALDDAKHRREAANRALAAALDTLNAAPAAGKG